MLASDRHLLRGMAVWKNEMIARMGRRMARPGDSRKGKGVVAGAGFEPAFSSL
jgi:hypothetical protein